MIEIEAIVKKYSTCAPECSYDFDRYSAEVMLREALTELAETHAIELRAYEATVQNQAERIRQLEAERQQDGIATKTYHKVAQHLYSLLDDIDTAGDIAKSDDALYRSIVDRTQSKKDVFVVSCDGYTVHLVDDSMLAAAPAKEDSRHD